MRQSFPKLQGKIETRLNSAASLADTDVAHCRFALADRQGRRQIETSVAVSACAGHAAPIVLNATTFRSRSSAVEPNYHAAPPERAISLTAPIRGADQSSFSSHDRRAAGPTAPDHRLLAAVVCLEFPPTPCKDAPCYSHGIDGITRSAPAPTSDSGSAGGPHSPQCHTDDNPRSEWIIGKSQPI